MKSHVGGVMKLMTMMGPMEEMQVARNIKMTWPRRECVAEVVWRAILLACVAWRVYRDEKDRS